ncbi:ABC transporter transmembrane region [Fusobacterium sp. CM21]|uniref:ABC transporter ATP-binding protein/permease n=1 Tax=Fusobacterium vincentii TaxID=155615 RepID=A0AAJ1CRZ6_FUSVC|nr:MULTISPECIES: ABC transporter ATP-binding protein [Fusobacterium]ETT04312.1 ABC transporter transmembrane region [Fusobacterium sp. CM21]ERT44449.1 ABC transporter ATP-binding protein [Fusobacterium nucleatum CTI-7]MCW0263038.1 ABC transporter ATP-binding protein/permease [Fusobacterium vincentii]MDH2314192.1 ABC transporter ATP-binding protein [Fusobacterium nucleatum]OHU83829.1 ABC transporter [Fusobacterium nucleatum]
MAKKKNQNEDSIKNFKKAVSNFISLLGEKKVPFLISIISNTISTILVVSIPWVSALAIDDIVKILNNTTVTDKWNAVFSFIIKPISALGIIAILIFALNYLQEYISAILGEQVAQSLRVKLSKKFTKLPMNFFDTNQVGDILSKLTTDIEKVAEVIGTSFTRFVYSFLIIILVIFMLFNINAKLTLIVLAILLISVIVTYYVSNLTQKIFSRDVTSLSELSSITEEALTGNLVIQSYNKQKDIIDTLDKSIEKQYSAAKTLEFTVFSIYPSIRFITQIAFVISAVISAVLVINGHLTLGLAQAFLQYVTQISDPVTTAAYIINSLQNALVSVERIYDILELPEEVDLTEDTHLLDNTKGQIVFENVSFGYTKDKLLMKNVNFTAKAEQMVAIVGPTGAGKTTLINLLMRFYDVNGGRILFDGVDISKVSRKELRVNFGMVLQDTWLFKGTIAENIAYGKPDATREEIIEAAKLAKCDSFIRKLPQGYDTIITSENGMVSQGEQQLLTIARTILPNPKVMILDEATSSIDTKTEKDIQAVISELMKGRTSFVIAHRLSTIRNADLILVMKDGDIVEQGNHDELLKVNGIYANLYNTQFNQ